MAPVKTRMWWTVLQDRNAVATYYSYEDDLNQLHRGFFIHQRGSHYRLARPEEARAAYAALRDAFGPALWDLLRERSLRDDKMLGGDGIEVPAAYEEHVDENPYAFIVCVSAASSALFQASDAPAKAPRRSRQSSR